MADSSNDSERQKALDEVHAAQQELWSGRGYAFNEFQWLAQQDPEFELARIKFSRLVFTRENPALPVKYRELIEAVLLSFKGYHTVGEHVRRALREGATMQEAVEAFEVATIPGGMPVLHFALPFLIEIDKDIKAGKKP
jgi:alkylhydroperoxidase/carboxymuconolactone decarboxylase family protein YurZ